MLYCTIYWISDVVMLVDRMEASNAVSKMEEEEMVSEETSGVSIESIKVG